MLLDEHALVLHEASARHARYRLAGRVGDKMDMELSVRHGLFYPTATPGEMQDWPRQCGDRRGSAPNGADSGHDSPGPSIFRPLRTGWEEYPANRESGGESPSNRRRPIHSALGTP